MGKVSQRVKVRPKQQYAAVPSGLVASMVPLALLAACGQRGELLGTKETVPSAPVFAEPQQVAALSSAATDEDPTFTGDLLELCFMSTRDGTKDIWTSHRAAANEPWGPPVRVAELSSPRDDWAPAISPDGLAIWFSTDRDAGHAQLWRASRATRAVAWGAPLAVPELASGAVDTGPTVDAAERTLYFASDRAGGGKFDIYVSTRPAVNAPWEAPVPAPGINTPDDEADPFIAASGLLLFLTRISPTNTGDIYWLARRSTTEPWATGRPAGRRQLPVVRLRRLPVARPQVHDVLLRSLGERGYLRGARPALNLGCHVAACVGTGLTQIAKAVVLSTLTAPNFLFAYTRLEIARHPYLRGWIGLSSTSSSAG